MELYFKNVQKLRQLNKEKSRRWRKIIAEESQYPVIEDIRDIFISADKGYCIDYFGTSKDGRYEIVLYSDTTIFDTATDGFEIFRCNNNTYRIRKS